MQVSAIAPVTAHTRSRPRVSRSLGHVEGTPVRMSPFSPRNAESESEAAVVSSPKASAGVGGPGALSERPDQGRLLPALGE